jgi:hypothetical protein
MNMKNHKGIFLHIFEDEEGESVINLQAELLGIKNNVARLQLYSWVDGFPNGVIEMPIKELLSKNITLYDNEKKWRESASYTWKTA